MVGTKELALLVGGFYNLGLAIFHTRFRHIFHWEKDLQNLTRENRFILQILNICLIFLFIVMAYISFIYQFELLYTGLGNALLLFIAIFWFLRLILQIVFWGIRNKLSNLFVLLFLMGGLLYISPLFL